ncbi:MAG TPA: Rossmann-like and DUF2520 domain-containing protein [Vulgatibacter sp.]|nr:Rossmann-like and DUF2520 domain-containing protein [Vulgatibacter sp.]
MTARRGRAKPLEARPRPPHLERDRASRSVFVLGAGRLGSALAAGLAAAGWEVETWTRSARRVVAAGARQRRGALPDRIDADLVLLTVPDRVIPVMAQLLADSGRIPPRRVVAHCAGAVGLDALAPLRELGAEVGSIHPLAAVSRGTDLAGHAAALDGSPAALRLLRRVARDVGLTPISIAADRRAAYHAAASLAANGLVSLADLAVEVLVDAGVPRARALDALVPLMESALRGLGARGLPDALTGPVSRADVPVVSAHLEALAGTAALEAYRVLALRAVSLAREQGADADGLDRISALLSRPARRRRR